jgi:cytoplasmic tRNA 2-thiolation protein 2
LIKYAEENSCTSILFGDTSTALAVSSIAETAMGMGAGFIADKGVETEWYGVPVARPIRDVSAKEVALYCYFNTLPTVGETEKDRGNSIARLTQDFLLGLDKEFPSTLMTINRTLGKVQPGDGGRCGDCGGVVVEDCDVWARRRTVRGVGGDGEEIVEGDGERVRGVCYGCLLVRKHLVEE